MSICEFREGKGRDATCNIMRDQGGATRFGCAFPEASDSSCIVVVAAKEVADLYEEGVFTNSELTALATRTALNGIEGVVERNGRLTDGSL